MIQFLNFQKNTITKKLADGRKLEINGIDIERDFTPMYEVDPGKKAVVKELQQLAKKSEGVLYASDSDREGEAISWHLAQVLGVKDMSTVQRLEFHEITAKAINEAMAHPRPLNVQLVHAQQARQVLDKLVGFKLSPVLWATMSNYKLSAGRVQSPALRLICDRENEILKFVPVEFWEIEGVFNGKTNTSASENFTMSTDEKEKIEEIEGNLYLKPTQFKGVKAPKTIDGREQLDKLVAGISTNTEFKVTSVTTSTERSYSRPPFTTSTLQQAASSRLGYTPKITMQIAQKLY
jgi:DNA topoisomerase-1